MNFTLPLAFLIASTMASDRWIGTVASFAPWKTQMGTRFSRRANIGSPPPQMDSVNYVLGKMNEDELALANQAIERSCQAVADWLELGIEAAMNKHN